MLLRWEIFTRPTRKLWLNQAYHASEAGDFNQAYQGTLVKPGLPSFLGGNFKTDLPENLGSNRLTRLLRWRISTRPTRKLWLNQPYQAFEVEILNQIYLKTLVQTGLPGFWGGKFQPGLPGKPGNTRLTKHFWLGFLSRDLSYQTFMVNYNQAYLESLVKPGSTRLSILVDNCQKPGKSGSTRVYQAQQAFHQTFGARVSSAVGSSPSRRKVEMVASLSKGFCSLLWMWNAQDCRPRSLFQFNFMRGKCELVVCAVGIVDE